MNAGVNRESHRSDVAVVGGGATGVAAAVALAKKGLEVALFAPPARIHSARTAALLAPAIGLLRELGAWNDLADQATALKAIRLVDGTRRLIRAPEVVFYASDVDLPRFGFNIANSGLVAALMASAQATPGLHIITETVSDLQSKDGEIALVDGTGAVTRARLVVGADGRNSVVARQAGIAMRTWSYPQSALVAILEAKFPHGGESTEIHRTNGPFTLVPHTRNQVALVWVDTPDALEAALAMPGEHFAMVAESHSQSVLGSLELASDRGLFPLSAALPERVINHRTVLIGEAAHLFPPIGAQGLNLGFRDVAALSRFVGRSGSDPGAPAALEAFNRNRMPDIRSRLYGVDLLNRSLLSDLLPTQLARGMALSAARNWAPFRRALIRQGLAAGAL